MKLTVRVDRKLSPSLSSRLVERRARFALTRFGPQLSAVTVAIANASDRGEGEAVCRVSATFTRGGTLHVHHADPHPRAAVDLALERFRGTVVRTLERRQDPRRQVPRYGPEETWLAGGLASGGG